MESDLLKKTILERRTIHCYNDKPIDPQVINEATECFLHAPNHRHTQPWKLLKINSEQRLKLANINMELKSLKKKLNEIEKKAITQKFTTPSHLIGLFQIKNENPFQSKEDYAAFSCAIMNMKLFLWSKNIGTKWSSGNTTYHKKTYDLLNIDSSKYESIGFLWAGYFDQTPRVPEKQKPDDVWL